MKQKVVCKYASVKASLHEGFTTVAENLYFLLPLVLLHRGCSAHFKLCKVITGQTHGMLWKNAIVFISNTKIMNYISIKNHIS